jgi:hypothetical protein
VECDEPATRNLAAVRVGDAVSDRPTFPIL